MGSVRLALRAVPGDRGPEDHPGLAPFVRDFGLLPGARRQVGVVPRQGSRHRGAPGDAPTYY